MTDKTPATEALRHFLTRDVVTTDEKRAYLLAALDAIETQARAEALDAEVLARAINNVEWVRGETWKPPTRWFEAYARNIVAEYRAILSETKP